MTQNRYFEIMRPDNVFCHVHLPIRRHPRVVGLVSSDRENEKRMKEKNCKTSNETKENISAADNNVVRSFRSASKWKMKFR